MRKLVLGIVVTALAVALAVPASAAGKSGSSQGVPGSTVEVYVTSQDLVYTSIVKTNLPPVGPFQQLHMGGPTGLYTEFGPGDVGYRGGRWWVDVDGNGEMNDGDAFFMCPLVGGGHPL